MARGCAQSKHCRFAWIVNTKSAQDDERGSEESERRHGSLRRWLRSARAHARENVMNSRKQRAIQAAYLRGRADGMREAIVATKRMPPPASPLPAPGPAGPMQSPAGMPASPPPPSGAASPIPAGGVPPRMRRGGKVKSYSKGGAVRRGRGDGCCRQGGTKGKMV